MEPVPNSPKELSPTPQTVPSFFKKRPNHSSARAAFIPAMVNAGVSIPPVVIPLPNCPLLSLPATQRLSPFRKKTVKKLANTCTGMTGGGGATVTGGMEPLAGLPSTEVNFLQPASDRKRMATTGRERRRERRGERCRGRMGRGMVFFFTNLDSAAARIKRDSTNDGLNRRGKRA